MQKETIVGVLNAQATRLLPDNLISVLSTIAYDFSPISTTVAALTISIEAVPGLEQRYSTLFDGAVLGTASG